MVVSCSWADGSPEGRTSLHRFIVQGKPVVRRGRKARDLFEDRPAADPPVLQLTHTKESIVKANLARFTGVLTLLASLALTLGAGIRWSH